MRFEGVCRPVRTTSSRLYPLISPLGTDRPRGSDDTAFTFELALAGSPRTSVEYDYVGKQSIPTTGLSPASPTALWAAGHRLILALFQAANLSIQRASRNPGPALLIAQSAHIPVTSVLQ